MIEDLGKNLGINDRKELRKIAVETVKEVIEAKLGRPMTPEETFAAATAFYTGYMIGGGKK